FPALRLVQQQRRSNARRFRLRHLWLLLLRMAALATIVLAIARPTLPAANYGLNLREFLTLAGVIAAGVIAYQVILSRYRSQPLPKYELSLKRAKLRGWSTGLTLLSAAFLAGCPYQRRVAAEITSPAPVGQFDLPVAAVFLFDNSLSLEYTQQGQTRLSVAKQLAKDHLSDFPAGSRVAIAEASNDDPVIFQASISAAQSRIDSIEPSAVVLPLNDRVVAAASLQRDDRTRISSEGGGVNLDRFVRRVYVFTDLAASGWRIGPSTALARSFEEQPNLTVQIVDVGELQPRNTSVGSVMLSTELVTRDLPLSVSAEVKCVGESGERKAVLSLMGPGGQFVPRDSQVRSFEAGSAQRLDFALLTGLTGPVVHGEIRLQSTDPLKFDDVRTFTVVVGAAPKVLLVAATEQESMETRAALDVVGFEPVVINPQQLNTADVSKYQVVYLLSIKDVSDEVWNKLESFVKAGGGLAVVLGSEHIDSTKYNRAAAQQILPARLDAWQAFGDYKLSIDRREHPIFWKFRQHDDSDSFAAFQNDNNIY
ncbi:MAG TPA: VWA domain-containing protein, partial [Caulifigura sp.]|nr:VWA domain-containing protein [Caulifigura sp.]